MSKKLLQDMVRIKSKRVKKEKLTRDTFNVANIRLNDSLQQRRIQIDRRREKISNKLENNRKKPKYKIYFIALVSIIFLLFALSYFFSGAEITIIPKVKEISLNGNFSATKDKNLSSLPFDLVVISGEENKKIEGGKMQDIIKKAVGTVSIYNSYSSSSQRLDINTRLEGSNGKIYKTSKKITVPGMTKNDKPGSVKVNIYGTVAGDEYNSSPLDFKILGFKGTAKYSKFYARSEGEITGGFKGKSSVLSSLDKVNTVSELKNTLKTKLLKKITNQIPNGFILFKNAIFLKIDDKNVSFTPDKNGVVSVNIKGALYGFLFDEKKLTKKIAQDIVDKYNDEKIYIPNIRNLTFSLIDKENISFTDVKNIKFNLSGIPKIIWKVDETKFLTSILGKKKNDFNKILSQYSSIDSAKLIINPFWKTTFPEKSKKIKIIVNYPK